MGILLGPLLAMGAHCAILGDLEDYELARVGGWGAVLGVGYEFLSSAKKWELPDFLDVIAVALAILGGIAFGAGLALGAVINGRK